MNVYEMNGSGSYRYGLAIVAAHTKKSAMETLQKAPFASPFAFEMFALDGVKQMRKVVYQGNKPKVLSYMDYIE